PQDPLISCSFRFTSRLNGAKFGPQDDEAAAPRVCPAACRARKVHAAAGCGAVEVRKPAAKQMPFRGRPCSFLSGDGRVTLPACPDDRLGTPVSFPGPPDNPTDPSCVDLTA